MKKEPTMPLLKSFLLFCIAFVLLIKRPTTYYFGNKKENISSVIGKNSLTNTLSPLGKALNAFLNWIDKDHSFNSIIYDMRRWARDKY